MQLGGPLGRYLLLFFDISPDFKNLFGRLMTCLEGMQRFEHTTVSLDTLQTELVNVLGECESKLPLFWCTGVKHYLLHVVLTIQLCGPFKSYNMLVFERWHTIFKRLARGRKNVLASIHHHWSMVLSSAAWRTQAQGRGDEWADNGFRSSLDGAGEIDHSMRVALGTGTRTQVELMDLEYGQVQDMWAVYNKTYDKLCDRYRNSRGENIRTSRSLVPVGLDPDYFNRGRGRPLTDLESNFLKMTPTVYSVISATMNNIPFTTSTRANKLATEDSVVKIYFTELEEDGGGKTAAYARISRLLIHAMFPGGPSEVIVDGEWFDVLPEKSDMGHTLVRPNPNNSFNTNCRFVSLDACEPYNVALLPLTPGDVSCNTFCVIDKTGKQAPD
jgi:hypothetical protein